MWYLQFLPVELYGQRKLLSKKKGMMNIDDMKKWGKDDASFYNLALSLPKVPQK